MCREEKRSRRDSEARDSESSLSQRSWPGPSRGAIYSESGRQYRGSRPAGYADAAGRLAFRGSRPTGRLFQGSRSAGYTVVACRPASSIPRQPAGEAGSRPEFGDDCAPVGQDRPNLGFESYDAAGCLLGDESACASNTELTEQPPDVLTEWLLADTQGSVLHNVVGESEPVALDSLPCNEPLDDSALNGDRETAALESMPHDGGGEAIQPGCTQAADRPASIN
jgi:hypothetical protein